MKRDLTVYVASCWWRDSDPHTTIVALTAGACEDAIERSMRYACEMYCEMYEEDEESGLDAQAWSGVFPESLRGILTNAGRYERQDIVDNLRASGVASVEGL